MSLHLEAAKRARRRSEASRRLDLHGMQLNGGEPIATNSDALDDKTVVRISTRPVFLAKNPHHAQNPPRQPEQALAWQDETAGTMAARSGSRDETMVCNVVC